MTTPRFGTLFHFTHLDNIPEILGIGALLADTEVQRRGLLRNECGELGIKAARRRRAVTCGAGGVVADYVPFYYAARSPMMLTLKSGHVPTFTGDILDFVYFVTNVDTAVAVGRPFAVSDRNARIEVADFSDDLAILGDLSSQSPKSDFVDWPLMKETYWHNIDSYPDRMERRMAEFLVLGEFPLTYVKALVTYDAPRRDKVKNMFDAAGWDSHRHVVRPDWYY